MTMRRVVVSEPTEEEQRVQRAREALHRDGASPAGALDILATIVEKDDWKHLGYDRFTDFARKELRQEPDHLDKVLKLGHPKEANTDQRARMDALRAKVREFLETEAKLEGHGGDRRSEDSDQGNNMTLVRGTSESYTRKRLRRDRPDLLERVDAGELSAHAAACQAGWQKRKISVPVDDPQAAARTLRRQLDHDALVQLVAALLEGDGA